MPGQRTAQQLADRTRDLVGVYDRTRLRDGFAADAAQAPRAILPAVNKAIQQILTTGIVKCRWNIAVAATSGEYPLDPGIGLIEYVTFQGRPLAKTSISRLDRETGGGWRGRTGARPFQWYNDESDVLGLYPAPSVPDPAGTPSVELLAESLTNDLVNPTDVPARVPSQFHDDLPVGAAYWLLIGMLGSDDSDDLGDQEDQEGSGEAVSPDILQMKLAEIRSLWGRPDDATEVGTVLARVRRFAQQRDQNEAVQAVPYEGRRYWARGGRY